MSIFESHNDFFSESSGSLDNDMSYQNVLRELNINKSITDTPIRLHVSKFGNFSIVCDSLVQVREVKSKLGLRGLLPLYPGTMVAKDKSGNFKYALTYDLKAKFPQVCFN